MKGETQEWANKTSMPGQDMNDFPRSVAIVANSDFNIYRFRAPIVRKLLELGVTVYAIAPPGRFVADIESMGAVFIPWELDRRSVNPLSAAGHLAALTSIYRRLRPDLVHHFTIKPNLYGTVAARLAGVPAVFGGVTGLGSAFLPGNRRHSILRSGLWLLYRASVKLSDCYTFMNQHDKDVLAGAGSSLSSKRKVIKGGAGIDLAAFSSDAVSGHCRERVRAELGIEPKTLVVCMASRLLYDKGVTQYVEAARLVRSRLPDVCFLLVGEPDPGNPGTVTGDDLDAWAADGSVKCIGHRDDIPAVFAISDVVAHPTGYPEGIPRVLIEAAAMGKPVVSTALPGVVDILEEGVNGISVPPRDGVELAKAIESLLADADLRCRYGAAGRRKVEAEYDSHAVAERYAAEYRRVWTYVGVRRPRTRVKERAFAPNTTDPGTNESAAQADYRRVSVIIPARNEEATIAATLDSVFSQEYAGPIEVIVADASDSPAMTGMVQASYPDVRIVPNPEQCAPAGLNYAIRESTGEVVVRCDAHATLPPGYVRRAVETLERTGAANVGGLQQAAGKTFFEKAAALAMNSLLGSGGARYRVGNTPGPTDTVYLGAWRRDTLEAVGGFNSSLIRNEDYELNWRLRGRGGTIWFDPELAAEYCPRGSMASLARQYFNYGRWKSTMLMLHPRSLRPRHLAAPLLALGLAASVGLAAAGAFWWAAALPLLYLAILALGAASVGLLRREPSAILIPAILAAMHLSWGIGFFIPARLPRKVRGDTSFISPSRRN